MTDYIVSSSDLTSIATVIRNKGGASGYIVFPGGFINGINNIQTGSTTSDFDLDFFANNSSAVIEENVEVNTSDVDYTIKTYSNVSGLWETGKRIHVIVKDTQGPRAGYFYGSETVYPQITGNDSSLAPVARVIYFCDSNGNLKSYVTTEQYGIYALSFNAYNMLTLKATYSQVYSRTINSTYKILVYKTTY